MRKPAWIRSTVGTWVPRYLSRCKFVPHLQFHRHWRNPPRTDHAWPYVSLPNLSSLLPCLSTINHCKVHICINIITPSIVSNILTS